MAIKLKPTHAKAQDNIGSEQI